MNCHTKSVVESHTNHFSMFKIKHRDEIKITVESIYYYEFLKIKQLGKNKTIHVLMGNIAGTKRLS